MPCAIAPWVRLCVPRTPSLIDYVIESPNVGGDDRSVMLPRRPVRLAVQVEVPTEAENAALRHQLIVLRRTVLGRCYSAAFITTIAESSFRYTQG
jgi:hypothetical protein